jgi:hypothetical protein
MDPDFDDLLAYLIVLNSPVVKLTDEQKARGNPRILGCLERAIKVVLRGTTSGYTVGDPNLAEEIRERERLNGKLPVDHPELVAATAVLANKIHTRYFG